MKAAREEEENGAVASYSRIRIYWQLTTEHWQLVSRE
jgi:hypothetical protein